jgi:hypothetical protein
MVTRQRIDRQLSIQEIKANPRNARTHSKVQIRQIAESIKAFGFGAPVLVDETLTLIGGYGRLKAAEHLNIAEIPELLSFPGRHDDQVDALTQGLAWGRQHWGRTVFVSFYRY